LPDLFTSGHRELILALAVAAPFGDDPSLPVFRHARRPAFARRRYRSASFIDDILKGDKSSDLPVQAPTNFEQVINLKAAKALASNCRNCWSPKPAR